MIRNLSETTQVETIPQFQDIYHSPESLLQWITEVTGLSFDVALQLLLNEYRSVGSTVWKELQVRRIEPYRWSDDLVQFYQSTDSFLFESLVWNRNAQKQQMRQRLAGILQREFARPARVLMFGDGLGFDSCCLSLVGHDVSYFEVSSKANGFAQRLFEHFGCSVRRLSDTREIEAGQFDAVVCLDVLEHVPNPAQTIGVLRAALHDEGCLIVHAPFWYLSTRVGTHLSENRRFCGDVRRLYRAHGLRPIDASLFWDPIVLTPTEGARVRSWLAGARLALGGSLLSIARFWCLPHVTVSHAMSSRAHGPWPELEAIAASRLKTSHE